MIKMIDEYEDLYGRAFESRTKQEPFPAKISRQVAI